MLMKQPLSALISLRINYSSSFPFRGSAGERGVSISLIIVYIIAAISSLILTLQSAYAEVYKTNETFLSEVFTGKIPPAKHVWLRDDLKKQVNEILKHPYKKLRVKYWMSADKSAWILEEVGKEQPITTGIVIGKQGNISKVEILAFHESRGWEVKYPFFLKQFIQAGLKADRQLDRHIDGITGATLSVHAVTRLVRMALLLHQHETRK